MMRYEHAPDWSWASGECPEDCGMKVTADLSADEAKKLRRPFVGAGLRRVLYAQIATDLHRRGCPHVVT